MAVTRFWVGGTNSFGNTSAWSASSGGASGASVPGSADTAVIDALSGGGTYTINGSPTVLSFSFVNVNKTDALSLSGSLTIAAGGSLSLTGNSVTNRGFIKSSVLGTQRSISVPSGATVTLTNVDIQDIASASTFGTWTGTSLGDALGNSGITFDPSVSPSLTGTGTINWSTAAVWSTGKVPLPQDDVSLGSSSTATTLTADMPRLGRNIDSSGYLKTLSFASTPNSIFGNITLGASATYSGTQALTLAGRGAQTITSNGKSFPQSLVISAFGGTYSLQDAFGGAAFPNLSLGTGTFTTNNFAVTLSGAYSQSAGTTLNGGTSVWTLSRTLTAWLTVAGATVNMSQSTILLTGNISTTATFQGSGYTYGTLNWSSTASTGTLIITGANTFAALQSDNTTARTIQFPNGVTQTIAPGGWQVSGKAGALISLTSASAGNQATLSMASGTVSADFLNINDSNATGGAAWFAGDNSVNTTPATTTGWTFTSPPVATGTVLTRSLAHNFTRKRYRELKDAWAAQELLERKAKEETGKRRIALQNASDAAVEAIEAVEDSGDDQAERMAQMVAALEASANAVRLAGAIKSANEAREIALAILSDIDEDEDEAIMLLLN